MTKATEEGSCSQATTWPAAAPISATPSGKTQIAVGYSKKQRREDIVAMIQTDLATPAAWDTPMGRKYIPGYNPAEVAEGYTTCGHMPQAVGLMWVKNYRYKGAPGKWASWVEKIGLGKSPKKMPDFIVQGLQALEDCARPTTSWIVSGGAKRPKPGDMYMLVEPVKTPKNGGSLAERHTRGTSPCHVGVILSCGQPRQATIADKKFFKFEAVLQPNGQPVVVNGNEQYIGMLPDDQAAAVLAKMTVEEWTTADAGQGVGKLGQKAMIASRLYQPASARISGELSQEPGDRWLEGWLDIDLYERWPEFGSEIP